MAVRKNEQKKVIHLGLITHVLSQIHTKTELPVTPENQFNEMRRERPRARTLGNQDFYADAGQPICKFCKEAVDHRSQSIINRHLISDKHKKYKNEDSNRKQANTITTAFKVSNAARLQIIRLVSNWVRKGLPLTYLMPRVTPQYATF